MPVKVGAAASWDRTTKPYLATKLPSDVYRRCSVHDSRRSSSTQRFVHSAILEQAQATPAVGSSSMSLQMRRCSAVAIATSAASVCMCSLADAQMTTSTAVYQAFTHRGLNRFRTRSRVGYCAERFEKTLRRDAWRCFSGNFIYDPCFNSARDPGIPRMPYRALARYGGQDQIDQAAAPHIWQPQRSLNTPETVGTLMVDAVSSAMVHPAW